MLAANLIINKLLQTKDYSIIKTNSLDVSYFEGYDKEFTFIEEHYKKYGNIPDLIVFLQKFPDFENIEVNETDDYLLDKLYEEHNFTCFTKHIPNINKLLKAIFY